MDIPKETSTNVMSLPRITNIPRALAILTVNVGEDESSVPKASQLERSVEAQLVTNTSVSSQPTYLLPSSIKSRLIRTDLERIKTLFGIPDEYQLRLANSRE